MARDITGLLMNKDEKVCLIGSLLLQYTMLQDAPRKQDFMDQLTPMERDRLFVACLDLLRSLMHNLTIDREAAVVELKQMDKENNRLIVRNDQLVEELMVFGVDMSTDKRERA